MPTATVRNAQRPGRRRRATDRSAVPIGIDGRLGPPTRGARTTGASDGRATRGVGRILERRCALVSTIRPTLPTGSGPSRATSSVARAATRARSSSRRARRSSTAGRRSLINGRISSTSGSAQGRARSRSGRAASGSTPSRATRGATSSASCAVISLNGVDSDTAGVGSESGVGCCASGATIEGVSVGVFTQPFNAARGAFLRFCTRPGKYDRTGP